MSTVEIIVGVLLLAALGYAWYSEKTRRKAAELERDTLKTRNKLNVIERKLDENKVTYDEVMERIDRESGIAPVPLHMLKHVTSVHYSERGEGES